MHKKKKNFQNLWSKKIFFAYVWSFETPPPPPVALVSNCTYLDWPLPLCAYLLCGWLHGGSVFNCKYSVFHIYLTFTFFSEFLCNFFPRQSQIKSIRTWQKFQPLSPGSQCWNQANFGKKAFQNQYWVQGWEKKFVQFLSHLFCPEF